MQRVAPEHRGTVVSKNGRHIPVTMVFADDGAFHDVIVRLPAEVLDRYTRIIDALREDPDITANMYVDRKRLVAAYIEPDDE